MFVAASAACGLSATPALLLGGLLTDTLGWPSVFLVNVPIGLAALACARILPADPARHAYASHSTSAAR